MSALSCRDSLILPRETSGMMWRLTLREHVGLSVYLIKWLLLATPVGIVVGSACALFLWSLDRATHLRFEHPCLLWLLPVAGVSVGGLYWLFGKSVEGGNNLIMDEIHEPGGGVPVRMAPLILIGTIVTHLFGGSAGREGTAVQMGGSLASWLARQLRGLDRHDVRRLLMAGIAAGFGGVFGTPVAGTIFALEVLSIGRITYAAILPCLVASIVSDQTCVWWGIGHTHYRIASLLPAGSELHLAPLTPWLLACTVLCGIVFGLTSVLFAESVHGLQHVYRKACPWALLRPALGGLAVVGLVWATGTRDYLGLGVTSPDPGAVTIVSCFEPGGAATWSWLWKLAFTAATLSAGFKGGEVTPLFFIGAALGNTLASWLGLPVDLFAGLGFVAVFAGATNTPIACTIMAVELFGGEYTVYFATCCLVAYLFSGHTGIYLSQRIGEPKLATPDWSPESSLRDARAWRAGVRAEASAGRRDDQSAGDGAGAEAHPRSASPPAN
ncbi:MAG: voltage-gated chloride channel family protein [Planctomyces sp.]|nr:voltage-gated chloride channel family protein [Planctomyces sp.]